MADEPEKKTHPAIEQLLKSLGISERFFLWLKEEYHEAKKVPVALTLAFGLGLGASWLIVGHFKDSEIKSHQAAREQGDSEYKRQGRIIETYRAEDFRREGKLREFASSNALSLANQISPSNRFDIFLADISKQISDLRETVEAKVKPRTISPQQIALLKSLIKPAATNTIANVIYLTGDAEQSQYGSQIASILKEVGFTFPVMADEQIVVGKDLSKPGLNFILMAPEPIPNDASTLKKAFEAAKIPVNWMILADGKTPGRITVYVGKKP